MARKIFGRIGALPMNPEEHPTSNIQRRTSNGSANPRSLRRLKFDVGRSMLSSVRGFQHANVHFGEISPRSSAGGPSPAAQRRVPRLRDERRSRRARQAGVLRAGTSRAPERSRLDHRLATGLASHSCPNLQVPNKLQHSKRSRRGIEDVWSLKFGICLKLGVWDLELKTVHSDSLSAIHSSRAGETTTVAEFWRN